MRSTLTLHHHLKLYSDIENSFQRLIISGQRPDDNRDCYGPIPPDDVQQKMLVHKKIEYLSRGVKTKRGYIEFLVRKRPF